MIPPIIKTIPGKAIDESEYVITTLMNISILLIFFDFYKNQLHLYYKNQLFVYEK